MNDSQFDLNRQDAPGYGVPLPTVVTFILIILLLPLLRLAQVSELTVFFICIVSAVLFSFLYNISKQKLLFLLPTGTYLISLLITKDFIISLESVAFVFAGTALFISIKYKLSRTQTIIAVSATLVVIYILYLLLIVIVSYKGINREILDMFWNDQTTVIKDLLASFTVEVDGIQYQLYDDASIINALNSMLLIMPAVIICAMNIAAYLITLVYIGLSRLFDVSEFILPHSPWEFTMSVISAYLYCAVYLISVFSGNAIFGAVTAVVTNIIILLTPGFALIGVKRLIRRAKSPEGRRIAVIYIVFTILIIILSPTMILTILSFVGVIETLISHHTYRNKDN